MKFNLALLLFLNCLFVFSQDTTSYYIDYNGKKVEEKNGKYIRKVYEVPYGTWNVRDFYLSGELHMEGTYKDENLKTRQGLFKAYYENGQMMSITPYSNNEINGTFLKYFKSGAQKASIDYIGDKKHGELISYWENGEIKRKDKFKKDKFKKGRCFDEEGKEVEYYQYEIMPEFPGGQNGINDFLRKNIRYPEEAKKLGINGKVFVTFVINKEGEVEGVSTINSVHPLLDNEALRVVSLMPNWKPGLFDGEKVKIRYNLPILFRLK